MDYYDMEELLVDIVKKYPDIESAEAHFQSLLDTDDELKDTYTEWCVAKGYHEKHDANIGHFML